MIDIKLVSTSRELHLWCQEILAGILPSSWSLSHYLPSETIQAADLYIWDYQPELQFPERKDFRGARHLFLVHRAHLNAFRTATKGSVANLILQPIAPSTLEAYLTAAVSAAGRRPALERRPGRHRDEMRQYLIDINTSLQDYGQKRTNFLARAVHDLRSPLTSFSGYCGLMLSDLLGDLNEDQREVIRRSQYSARRLSGLTNAMSEVCSGKPIKQTPDIRPADIRACLDQAIHEVTPFARNKQITIALEAEPSTPQLQFEPTQIEHVLINVLDNACKFTDRHGKIQIHGYPFSWDRRGGRRKAGIHQRARDSVSAVPNSYRVDVGNSGPGIPKERLKDLFEEYAANRSREDLRSGMGLAICGLIVRQHNGWIWAENTETGPTVAFVLPFHTESAADGNKRTPVDINQRGGNVRGC